MVDQSEPATEKETLANGLAAAYAKIPEAARVDLEAAARARLSAEGAPVFMQILPMIRDMMVRLWLGELLPV